MMRTIPFTVFLTLFLTPFLLAGVEQTIPPEIFQKAGLSKLTPGELAVLKQWVAGEKAVSRKEGQTVLMEAELPQGEDAFGVEQVESRMAKLLKSDIERIETQIKGKLRGWGGGTHFYLQNGQVWKQIDSSSLRYNLTDADVVLFKGAMGTYWLKPTKLNSKVRVRRVK